MLPQRADAPDMVYAMNLGLGVLRPDGTGVVTGHVVMSHMRYAERRMETPPPARGSRAAAAPRRTSVATASAPTSRPATCSPGATPSSPGYGPRTEELALKHLASDLGVRVRGVRITHPAMYHLDLAFCPLDDRRAMVAPGAFDDASARALLDLVPEPLVLTDEEALSTFCANSIVVGDSVVMPAGSPDRVKRQLEDWGFEVVEVDVSEFHKGGGSIRCLTNPVDVVLGRDVPIVLGGDVVVPPLD